MSTANTTVLIAVRHGETEWNLVGRQQGHMDSPLTEHGVKQAVVIAEALADKNIEAMYSSDLGRALQTARIIGRRISIDLITDARLRERHFGPMQGITKEEFAERYPEEAAVLDSGDPEHVLPGGESVRQRHERCVKCAEDIARRHAGQKVLVVAHAGVLSSFLRKTLELPLSGPRRFSLFNGSINTFSITDGRWRLETWGDISHMEGMTTLDDS